MRSTPERFAKRNRPTPLSKDSPMTTKAPDIDVELKVEEASLRRSIRAARGQPVPVPDTLARHCPFCGKGAEIQPWHGGGRDKHFIGCIGTDDGGAILRGVSFCYRRDPSRSTRSLEHPRHPNPIPQGVERMREALHIIANTANPPNFPKKVMHGSIDDLKALASEALSLPLLDEGENHGWAALRATCFRASHRANLRCPGPAGFNQAQGCGR
jgi:hypothetical protein